MVHKGEVQPVAAALENTKSSRVVSALPTVPNWPITCHTEQCGLAAGGEKNSRSAQQRREWSEELQEPPDPEAFVGWPDSPVLLRASPRAKDQVVCSSGDEHARLRMGVQEPLEFETDLFKGRALFWLRDLAGEGSSHFASKKRQSWLVVQGKFKRPLSGSDVLMGQEFDRRWTNLPAEWFVERVALKLARGVNSTMEIGPLAQPHMLAPLLALAQIVNVSRDGEEPAMMDAEENMVLASPSLQTSSGQAWSASKRRSHFGSGKALAATTFDTEHVWTFHVWQQFINLVHYKLELPLAFGTFDLLRHMNGQPLQFMAKHQLSKSYLFSFDVWHQGLLEEGVLSSHPSTSLPHAVQQQRDDHTSAGSQPGSKTVSRQGSRDTRRDSPMPSRTGSVNEGGGDLQEAGGVPIVATP